MSRLPHQPQYILDRLYDISEKTRIGPKRNTYKCATGDNYVTLLWTSEGEYLAKELDSTAYFDTSRFAWKMFLVAFDEYSRHKDGTIHWRAEPEMQCEKIDGKYKFQVYCRLFREDDKEIAS